ncbi:ATP-dependent DNA ligase [Annulohypoxylon maeteangense]|uniref:ATP-dependent DNA ligase n=1 Tax=Annulohypoxylon maeteangense TaxID=1927788 RepID=UPI0020077C93|nr:ATP-dependent DNA ligase [Annulohypoxylon maeteangense]KAI0886742.1 ATP-dependent DNA ligase [Annulohypoxylon maeteangense]
MSSPTKKRKLNSGTSKSSGLPSRGLEYFFSKQKQNKNSQKDSQEVQRTESPSLSQDEGHGMTDEELARKLQAEWNKETETTERASGSLTPSTVSNSRTTPGITETSQISRESPNLIPEITETEKKGKGTLSLQSVSASVDSISETIPFDDSPLTFDTAEYVSKLRDHWVKDGGDASYALLTRCFVLVNGTSSRIKIVDTLVNCLRVLIEADPESLLPAVWLATNSISPPYISLELGLGGSAISKALKNVCGLDSRSLKAIYDKYGDAGDVAFEAKKKQSFTLRKPRPLTIKGVYQSLVKVANSQGQGSAEVKQRIVDRLLQDARGGEESRYVVRTLCQHLRIGAVKTTMLIALSRAFLLSRPPNVDFPLKSVSDLKALKKEELAEVWSRAEEIVKACFARRPNYNDLIPTMLEIGVCDELSLRCDLALHIPLRPMLGSITRDLSEMLTKLQGRDFACEFKYDGQRAQVHCDEKGKVSIFSRHLEVMTDKYPDLVALVPKIRGEGVSSFIMEGEVVAVDQQTGELRNFQTLTNRARKDVEIGSITIEVCLFAFDLMYLNGQPLLDRPFRERRSLLRSLFIEIPHRFTWVKSLDATSQDSEVVLDFFKQATDTKCEGIMVKILDNLPDLPAPSQVADDLNETTGEVGESETLTLPKKSKAKKGKGKAKDTSNNGAGEEKKPSSRRKALLATYEPDKRLDSWLKVKKDYSSSFDTLDLVPIAAWHGQGRKAKWWSPILMAVRNDATGSLEAVCKCISGFTDTFYKANKKFYDDGSGEEPHGPDVPGKEGEEVEDNNAGKYKNVRGMKPSFIEYYGPEPDVWFEPQEVWEMAFADITLSPIYTASIGLISQERGLSMRFPRFLKKREDKGIEEASSSEFLAGLYRKQEAKAPTTPANQEVEDGEEEEL